MDCSTCINRCKAMISRDALESSGVRQENVRQLKLAKMDVLPPLPYDAEVLLDSEDKTIRPGEAFVIEYAAALRFTYATVHTSGAMLFCSAVDPAKTETIAAADAGKAVVIGRVFGLTWLS